MERERRTYFGAGCICTSSRFSREDVQNTPAQKRSRDERDLELLKGMINGEMKNESKFYVTINRCAK